MEANSDPSGKRLRKEGDIAKTKESFDLKFLFIPERSDRRKLVSASRRSLKLIVKQPICIGRLTPSREKKRGSF